MQVVSISGVAPTVPLPLALDAQEVAASLGVAASSSGVDRSTFGGFVKRYLDGVNHADRVAERSMLDVESGEDNLIETVVSIQKASQSLMLLIQVRNTLLEGYREIMDQPI